jgi:hypothetical protein
MWLCPCNIDLCYAGQAWLYAINGKNYEELFIAFEQLAEDLMIVVSTLINLLSIFSPFVLLCNGPADGFLTQALCLHCFSS